MPHPFPSGLLALLRIAAKRATEANYHLSFLPQVAPWLFAYRANSTLERRIEFAEHMRPLFARARARARGADRPRPARERYLRKDGWLKLYRSEAAFAATAPERELAGKYGLPFRALDVEANAGARAGAGAGVSPGGALAGSGERHRSAGA